MAILSEPHRARPTCAGLTEPQLDGARRRDPRDDHRHGRRDRRPPRLLARRRRADDRAAPAARLAARPDRLGHRPPGLPAQAADRPARAVRDAPPARRRRRLPAPHRVASTTSSTAATPARACRSREGLADGARPAPRHGADRGRRRRRGADERPVARGAQRHRPAPDADADRAQRQRDVDQPDGRRVLEVPLADQALARLAAEQDAPTTGRSSASRSSARTALELSQPAARVGRELRPAGPAVRGPRDHLHRRRARATTSARCSRPSARRSSCTGRSSSTSGPRRAAATGRPSGPGRLPRRGAAADGTRRADGDALDGARRPGAGPRCRPSRWPTTPRRRPPPAAPKKTPELHRGLRRPS